MQSFWRWMVTLLVNKFNVSSIKRSPLKGRKNAHILLILLKEAPAPHAPPPSPTPTKQNKGKKKKKKKKQQKHRLLWEHIISIYCTIFFRRVSLCNIDINVVLVKVMVTLQNHLVCSIALYRPKPSRSCFCLAAVLLCTKRQIKTISLYYMWQDHAIGNPILPNQVY